MRLRRQKKDVKRRIPSQNQEHMMPFHEEGQSEENGQQSDENDAPHARGKNEKPQDDRHRNRDGVDN